MISLLRFNFFKNKIKAIIILRNWCIVISNLQRFQFDSFTMFFFTLPMHRVSGKKETGGMFTWIVSPFLLFQWATVETKNWIVKKRCISKPGAYYSPRGLNSPGFSPLWSFKSTLVAFSFIVCLRRPKQRAVPCRKLKAVRVYLVCVGF